MIRDLTNQAEGNQEIVNWINTVIVKNQDHLTQTEAEHIIDYLKSSKAPKRLRRMSLDQAKQGAEKWNASLIKKAKDIIETDEDTEIIHRFKKSGRVLVKLVGENAFKREGKLMRHCVASYYGNNYCEVYSLRDAAGNPHCTFEVRKTEGEITQIKGKGNGKIHTKYINDVLKICKKVFKMDIRESEMINIGYLPLTEEEWDILNSLKDVEVPYIIYQNKKYLYLK